MTAHVPTQHSSLIGGSTAARRINCPRSYKLEQIAPKTQGGTAAREGTALHEMMAQILGQGRDPQDMLPFTYVQEASDDEPAWKYTIDDVTWDDNGWPALEIFDDFMDALEEEQGTAAQLMVEQSAEFPGVPGAFGTSDVPFRCGKVGGIIDWKFGRHRVPAQENEQLLFYYASLAAKYPKFYEGVERVQLVIIQPKVNDREPDVYECTPIDVEDFVVVIQETVKELHRDDCIIDRGPWCRYADCKAVCPLHVRAATDLEKAHEVLEALKNPTAPEAKEVVEGLVDVDSFLAHAMEVAEIAEDWAKHIAGATQAHLEQGQPVPGWKLVEKRSSGRDWTKEEPKIVNALRYRGLKADDMWTKKLVSPAQAEKKLKKIGKDLPEELYEKKPSSGYTLVREDDPRNEAGAVSRYREHGDELLNAIAHLEPGTKTRTGNDE